MPALPCTDWRSARYRAAESPKSCSTGSGSPLLTSSRWCRSSRRFTPPERLAAPASAHARAVLNHRLDLRMLILRQHMHHLGDQVCLCDGGVCLGLRHLSRKLPNLFVCLSVHL